MPKAEYVQYLRTQGATAEDVAALTEGSFAAAAIKAFDAQQAAAAAELTNVRTAAEADKKAYKDRADEWYNGVAAPALETAQQAKIKSDAEVARLRSLVAQSTDEGLKKVAKDMGYTIDGGGNPPAEPNPAAPNFDANQYFTRQQILEIAQQEGDAIAIAQDIAFEHRQLFPDKPLNFRAMRAEALAAKKSVEQYWMEKFGVAAAREKRDTEARVAHENKLREEGRAEVRRQYAEQAANPGQAPGAVSSNPVAFRPSAGRDKQPWDTGLDGANGAGNRTERATKVFVERQAQVH